VTPKNCPRCGKLFVKIREPICEKCVKEEEQIYEKVREYVKDNPDQTIQTICEACDVTTKRILQYLKDGRLEASKGLQSESVCSKCGKPILSGRMCEKCVLDVNFQVGDMKAQSSTKTKGPGMYTQ